MHWRWDDRDSADACVQDRADVVLEVRRGVVQDVAIVPPGVEPRRGFDGPVTSLGAVDAARAADFLLSLAYDGASSDAAEDAILPAMLTDSGDRWEELLDIARSEGLHRGVRKSAFFWVGQAAANVVAEELSHVAMDSDEDQEIRNAAVFALSQRDEAESVPVLMELAQDADEAETRRTAMFWLAQSDDPRVVAFFQDILVGWNR